jgi:hypothetical protein
VFLPVFQSGDLTDTGYLVVNYNWFFRDYLNYNANSELIFTEFIGACWLMNFGDLGILGLRFFSAIIVFITVCLIYRMYTKKYGNELLILVAIFSGLCYFGRWDIRVLSYDTLTLFFLVLILFLEEIKNYSKWISYFIVIILFALILTKITNIFFAVIYILTQFAPSQNKSNKSLNFSYPLFFISVLLFIISWKTGFLNKYLHGLLGTSVGSSYSFSKLAQFYIVDLISFLPYFLLFLLTMGILMLSASNIRIFNATMVLLLIGLLLKHSESYGYNNSVKYLYPAALLFYLLLILYKKKYLSKGFVLVISASVTLFIGSGTGVFLKLGYATVFLAPYVTGELIL